MAIQYTQTDVYNKLLAQGYTPERAQAVAATIGDLPEQSSSIMPDLVEGSTYAALAAGLAGKEKAANKALKAIKDVKGDTAKNLLEPGYAKNVGKSIFFGKYGAPLLAANAASMLYPALSGNNYYEQASLGQLGLNLAGQLGGGMAAEHLTRGLLNELGDETRKKLIPKAARKAVAGVVGPKLAARALGGTLGGIAGPIGSILGSVAGGYLLPKLFANSENENFLEPDKGLDGSTLAALAAAGTIASPVGRPLRKLVSDNIQWAAPVTKYPKEWAGKVEEFMSPLTEKVANNSVVQAAKKGFNQDLDNRRKSILSSYENTPDPNSFKATGYNMKDTLAQLQALSGGVEGLGAGLGQAYKKRKQQ